MAFFGLFGNYSKPGPGVNKEEEDRSPFSKFFVVYYRRLSKFMQLNLIFMIPFFIAIIAAVGIFILPVQRWMLTISVSAGTYELNTWGLYAMSIPFFLLSPFWGGVMVVARRMAKEEYSFIWSEYWKGVKENFKQFLANGIITYFVYLLSSFSLVYYNTRVYDSWLFVVPIALIITMLILFLSAQFYVSLLIVSVELTLKQIYKNSLIFSFMGLKKNLICLAAFIVPLAIVAFCLLFNWIAVMIGCVIIFLWLFSFLAYANCFICYPVIVKYIVDPMRNPNEEGEKTESIMKDESFEDSLASIAKKADEQALEEAPKYVYVNGKLIRSDELNK